MNARGLKPCPFCGSCNVAQGASGGYISVWCFCGARGPDVAFPDDCIDPATPIRECYDLWNRRTPILRDDETHAPTVERCAKVAGKLTETRTGYHGHKTLADGSHVPLTKDEADAIRKAVEEAAARRAQEMPTAQDALRVMIAARQRLQELGWWEGGGLRIKPGDECAVAQTGSTGMWRGRIDAERKYVHYGDSVSYPRKCWLKPLADLTDDERAWMDECDRREAEAYTVMLDRYAALEREKRG